MGGVCVWCVGAGAGAGAGVGAGRCSVIGNASFQAAAPVVRSDGLDGSWVYQVGQVGGVYVWLCWCWC